MHKWDPAGYEKSSSAQYNWAMELTSSLDLKGDERILDIGCGDGKITSKIACLVPRGEVLGIDLSPEMVSFAQRKHSRELYPNLFFEVKDAACLDFQEEFDLAVSFACLHWIKDHRIVLEGVRRGLRPGGRILFQCGGRGNAAEVLRVADELIKSDKWSRHYQGFVSPYYFYSPEDYRLWLDQVGFKSGQAKLVPKDMVHAGQAGLEGFVRTTFLPYLERLPEHMQQGFASEVARRYIEIQPLDTEGRTHVQMIRLQIEAEKP